jgi:hypothetical protein
MDAVLGAATASVLEVGGADGTVHHAGEPVIPQEGRSKRARWGFAAAR